MCALQLQCTEQILAASVRHTLEFGMSRLLFLLAVAIVVYLLLKSYRRQMPKQDTPASSEEMVRCVVCGVHLPKSESILAGGKFFCSEAHRSEHISK